MAFTNIPNGNLQVGAPLRSVDILALRDNIPAVMNGDTGAPKIKAAAFAGQSGAAPVFAERAWVNFKGTGTVAIRGSGNVSSITDNATGDYTVNFATSMPDENYCLSGAAGSMSNTNSNHLNLGFGASPLINSVRINLRNQLGNRQDPDFVFVKILR